MKHGSLHLGRGIPNILAFRVRIGEAITTIANPPAHTFFALDSGSLLEVEEADIGRAFLSGIGVYGNVPGGEGGLLAQRSFGGPWY